jgi:hypothetical protein
MHEVTVAKQERINMASETGTNSFKDVLFNIVEEDKRCELIWEKA